MENLLAAGGVKRPKPGNRINKNNTTENGENRIWLGQ